MLWIGNGRVVTRDNGAFWENGAVVTDGEKSSRWATARRCGKNIPMRNALTPTAA